MNTTPTKSGQAEVAKKTDRGIVTIRGYTVRTEHYPTPGTDGIREFDVRSSRTKQGVLAPGLRVHYPLSASAPCRAVTRSLSGPAGLSRIAMRVGVGEEQPLVAVLFFHFSETLVAVATENRPLVEAQLIKPDFLHRKAIALNASSVVLVHAHTWESSPIPTGKEVGLGLNLFNNLRNFGVQLSDHLILGKCDNSTPEIFSFLMHGMLPVRTPEGEWQWGKLRYP